MKQIAKLLKKKNHFFCYFIALFNFFAVVTFHLYIFLIV